MVHNRVVAALAVICLAVGVGVGAFAQEKIADLVWRWPNGMDAVIAAPKIHKVLYEDAHISLLEVTVQPGEQEPLHGHRYPSVFARDAIQPHGEELHEDGTFTQYPDRYNTEGPYPTCSRRGPQAPHGFHNLDTIPQHFYRLQFKQVDGDNEQNLQRYLKKK